MMHAAEQNPVEVTHDELAELMDEHQALEARLAELDTHVYLLPQEQQERKRVQKRKLMVKDRIFLIQRRLEQHPQ